MQELATAQQQDRWKTSARTRVDRGIPQDPAGPLGTGRRWLIFLSRGICETINAVGKFQVYQNGRRYRTDGHKPRRTRGQTMQALSVYKPAPVSV